MNGRTVHLRPIIDLSPWMPFIIIYGVTIKLYRKQLKLFWESTKNEIKKYWDQISSNTKNVSYKDLKEFSADLKQI